MRFRLIEAIFFAGLIFGMVSCGPIPATPNGTATTTPTNSTSGTGTTTTTVGTGTTTPTSSTGGDASSQILQARSALESHDIQVAHAKFTEALKVDPSNKNANLGLALTSGILLIQDPDIVSLIQRSGDTAPSIRCVVYEEGCPITTYSTTSSYGTTGTSTFTLGGFTLPQSTSTSPLQKPTPSEPWSDLLPPLYETVSKKITSFVDSSRRQKPTLEERVRDWFPKKTLRKMKQSPTTSNPPTISEIQSVIDNKVLPVLDGITDKLAVVEGSGFVFNLTPKMQTNPNTAETILLDDGEFLLFDYGIRMLKVILLQFVTAYHWELDYDAIDTDPLSVLYGTSAMSQSFFTLKPTGMEKLTKAHNEAKIMIAKLKEAHTFLESDPDTTTDNGVRFPPPEVDFTPLDHENAHYFLEKMEAALNGETTIAYDEGADNKFGTSDDKTRRVDITKLFTNPLDRSFLPQFGYDLPRNAALSTQHGECVSFEHFPNATSTVMDDIVRCDVAVTANFPEMAGGKKLTLNGLLPDGIPDFDGILPLAGAVYIPGLDKPYWSYGSWSADIASDGTLFYLAYPVQQQQSSTSSYTPAVNRIFHVDSTTGTVHHKVDVGGEININGIAHLNGAVWASGSGNSPPYTNGVFHLDVGPTGTGAILQTISQTQTSCNSWGKLTADGSQLYLSSYVYTSNSYGLCIFLPTALTIPDPKVFVEDGWGGLAHDGTDLWVGGNKINIATGEKKTYYVGAGDAGAFQGGFLWASSAYRLLKYKTAP